MTLKSCFYSMFLIGLLSSCQNETPTVAIEQEVTSDTTTLIFAGDIMCHDLQLVSAKVDSTYDFAGWFQHVQPIISKADIAFCNLETTLSSTGPYSGYPRFKSPDELAYALKDAGFDVIVTSNNHSNDTGPKGVVHTIDVLKSLGLYQTGTFKGDLEKELLYPLIIEMSGLKIALLNYTYSTNGIPTRAPAVVNLIDTLAIKEDIALAKASNPDLIISFMHWGEEYRPQPSTKQVRLTKMMLREGVNHIIGAHPHVVQPVKNIDDHIVAYSLGNFISDQYKKLTDGGIMMEMTVVKEKNQTRLLDWRYIPVWRYRIRSDKTVFEIIPSQEFISDTSYFYNSYDFNALTKFHHYIEHQLSD